MRLSFIVERHGNMAETERKVLSKIRERIERVITKIDSMTDIQATADQVKSKQT
ncbi:hypothetical protein [Brevibacillus porteri]|uniref:hypothetical protein n=1 Tax=Brevibacillus porteri TaxID=2126350 RepID=UPI003D1FC5AF